MEEKVLIQSQPYNIKKAVIRISLVIVALSIIASLGMYLSSYSKAVEDARNNYNVHYLTYYNEKVEEYNDYLKRYETDEEQTINCDHAETQLVRSAYSGKIYAETLPMTKEKFLEHHPTAKEYIICRYEYYENFNKYKSNYIDKNSYKYDMEISYLPLLLNILIPFLFLTYLWLRSYSLTITDMRVYGKVAWGKRVDLPVDSISAIATIKLFNGVSVSTSSGKISFLVIKNSNEIYTVMNNLLIERQQEKSNATTIETVHKSDEADQLKKYKDLLDSGVITQEEFDAKEKQLLGL